MMFKTGRDSCDIYCCSGETVLESKGAPDSVVWIVQLSDLHFSVHHPNRAQDFTNLVSPALSIINPSLVLITGDLIDGKSEDLLTMKQNEDEWVEYKNVMDDVIERSGLHKSLFYDLKGNHDSFGVPDVGGSFDFFSKYNINGRLGRNGSVNSVTIRDVSMAAIPIRDENVSILHMKNDLDAKASEGFPSVESLTVAAERPIPPSSILKQLAIVVKAGRKENSMKYFITSSGSSLPAMERAGLSLSAVKALVLREKDDKLSSEFCSHEKVLYLINSLFNPAGEFLRRKINSNPDKIDLTSFIRDIHGAPPESLVVKLAEVIKNFKTLREMEFFWCRVVAECRSRVLSTPV